MTEKSRRMAWAFLVLALGGVITYSGTKELRSSMNLGEHAKPTPGQVLEKKRAVEVRLPWYSYYLTVSYTPPGGQTMTKKVKVNWETFKGTQAGSGVKVFYLPDDPSLCQAGDWVEWYYGTFMWGLSVLGWGVLLWVTRNYQWVDTLARLSKGLKPMMMDRYEYVPARIEDFGYLDLGFYDEACKFLKQRDYRMLADEENITLRFSGGIPTFLRLLLRSDRTAVACLCHFKVRDAAGNEPKVLELETWFANGHFVCTNNVAQAGVFDWPEEIHPMHVPAETPWEEIISAHEEQVRAFQAIYPDVDPIKINGLQEVHRMQNQLQRLKAEYRRENGVSKAELERLVGERTEIDVERLHTNLSEKLEEQKSPAALFAAVENRCVAPLRGLWQRKVLDRFFRLLSKCKFRFRMPWQA